MIARVDGRVVSPESLAWPELNFGQFGSGRPIIAYELELTVDEFVERLRPTYLECIAELKDDHERFPDQESELRSAGYPSLDVLPSLPAALFEAVRVYLWDDLFAAFLPAAPSSVEYTLNSIDSVTASSNSILIVGRGHRL